MSDFKPFLDQVCRGEPLSREAAQSAFGQIMAGEIEPVQIAAFLIALKVRGETPSELTGAVEVMRANMLPVSLSAETAAKAMDIVGTGGDGKGSYNVSTAAAFVVAGAGIPVAKHGNRAVSSNSGSADVLTALGVNLDLPPEGIARCVEEAGIGFMFAPMHHSAMKHVGPTRAQLGQRTIFNLIGPLSNPAGVKRQLVGVYEGRWLVPMAETLRNLGCEAAWIVHGADGMDELTTTGKTQITELKDGEISQQVIDPAELGLAVASEEDLVGGDAAFNAAALRGVLDGQAGPYLDIVLLNAAASLCVAGSSPNLEFGLKLARESIDSGAAKGTLNKLIHVSNDGAAG